MQTLKKSINFSKEQFITIFYWLKFLIIHQGSKTARGRFTVIPYIMLMLMIMLMYFKAGLIRF